MKVKTKTKTVKDKLKVPPGQKSEKPLKKKKKIGTALAVIDGASLPKPKMKDMRSYFGKHTPVILEMIEMNDNDGALTLLKKKLLQTTVSLVPFAEDIIRNSSSQRGIYQYTTLVSQVRELISDIRADEDRKYIAQSLLTTVLQPAFMEVAQHVITDHHEFRKSLERHIKPESTQQFNTQLQTLAKELARKMMEIYKEVDAKTQAHLKS